MESTSASTSTNITVDDAHVEVLRALTPQPSEHRRALVSRSMVREKSTKGMSEGMTHRRR